MRILRLFISQDLNVPINWVMVNDDGSVTEGTSTFEELAQFEEVQVDVYLDARCCNIFNRKVRGISNKRLNEELALGLIEEDLIDDIELVKPVILRVEDDVAYIAVFNRDYYESLLEHLAALNKPLRLIQSFVFATLFEEGSWTVYLSHDSYFVRVSRYEYFLLDDAKPLPEVLVDMLANVQEAPKNLLLYSDFPKAEAKLKSNKQNIPVRLIANEFNFDQVVWNFYNQQSSKFRLKLDDTTKNSLDVVLRTVKYFATACVLFWVLNVASHAIAAYHVTNEIKLKLNGVIAVDSVNASTVAEASNKITMLKHQRGLYDKTDAIPLLQEFLVVVSNIKSDDINQISYDHGRLEIFVGGNFNPAQFGSYVNILRTKQIVALIQSYKSFMQGEKKQQGENDGSSSKAAIIDSAWVITLRPAFMYETKGISSKK